ncbi:MAG: hypothetical protein U0T56_00855 [Ferruginibacter sp.]
MAENFEEIACKYIPSSAMGFSCFSVFPKDGFSVKVNVGVYELKEYSYQKEDGTIVTRKAYYRSSLNQEFVLAANEVPFQTGKCLDKDLIDEKNGNKTISN